MNSEPDRKGTSGILSDAVVSLSLVWANRSKDSRCVAPKPLATDAAWDECMPEDKGAWENEAGRQIDRSMRPVQA